MVYLGYLNTFSYILAKYLAPVDIDKKVANQVIQTYDDMTQMQCLRECTKMRPECVSINHNAKTGTCELNAAGAPGDFANAQGWTNMKPNQLTWVLFQISMQFTIFE